MLERDGLVTITRPLIGAASAFTVRVAHLTAQGQDVLRGVEGGAPAASRAAGDPVRLGDRQREALTMLGASPDGLDAAAFTQRGGSGAALKRLADLGLISFTRRRIERDPSGHASAAVTVRREIMTLTDEQDAAL